MPPAVEPLVQSRLPECLRVSGESRSRTAFERECHGAYRCRRPRSPPRSPAKRRLSSLDSEEPTLALFEQPRSKCASNLERSGFAAVSDPSGRSSSRQTALASDFSATDGQALEIVRWRDPYRTARRRSVRARHHSAAWPMRRVGRSTANGASEGAIQDVLATNDVQTADLPVEGGQPAQQRRPAMERREGKREHA